MKVIRFLGLFTLQSFFFGFGLASGLFVLGKQALADLDDKGVKFESGIFNRQGFS